MDVAFAEALPRHLGMVLDGSESVRDFRHWFSSAWWEAEASAPEELAAYASRIENFTFILDSGVWDDAAFVKHLLSLVNRLPATGDPATESVGTGPMPTLLRPDRTRGVGQRGRLQLIRFAPLTIDRSVRSTGNLVLNLER